MIIIVSSSGREASIFITLCDFQRWPCEACSTASAFLPLAQRTQVRAVVVRHQLEDGYSDDILARLQDQSLVTRPKAIVLMAANCTVAAEARQVQLGADLVLRDPLRLPVLLEYLTKYRSAPAPGSAAATPAVSWRFAGVEVFPHEHRISANGRGAHLAPQEVSLLQLLHRQQGRVVTYAVLYGELFNRRFAGETANSRVLLGKVAASFRNVGVDLRAFLKVIPKSGYLYTPDAPLLAQPKVNRSHAIAQSRPQSVAPKSELRIR